MAGEDAVVGCDNHGVGDEAVGAPLHGIIALQTVYVSEEVGHFPLADKVFGGVIAGGEGEYGQRYKLQLEECPCFFQGCGVLMMA